VIIMVVEPEEAANHMPPVRLILMCSGLPILTISPGEKRILLGISVAVDSETPGEVMTRLCVVTSLSSSAIFIATPPSSHSLRVNGRPVVGGKVSTLHFEVSPPSIRVL